MAGTFYDKIAAGLGAIKRRDAFPYVAEADVLTMKDALVGAAPLLATGVCAEVRTGGTVGATTKLAVSAESIVAVVAFLTAGPFTPAQLLIPTTNYTVSGTTFTWVTDESAETCLILYIPTKP